MRIKDKTNIKYEEKKGSKEFERNVLLSEIEICDTALFPELFKVFKKAYGFDVRGEYTEEDFI